MYSHNELALGRNEADVNHVPPCEPGEDTMARHQRLLRTLGPLAATATMLAVAAAWSGGGQVAAYAAMRAATAGRAAEVRLTVGAPALAVPARVCVSRHGS